MSQANGMAGREVSEGRPHEPDEVNPGGVSPIQTANSLAGREAWVGHGRGRLRHRSHSINLVGRGAGNPL